jgi:hypothetical protein
MAQVDPSRSAENGGAQVITPFTKETLIGGKPVRIQCLDVSGQSFSLSKGPATVVRLEDEWFEDVRDPEGTIAALKSAPVKADIFTFWQRLPDTQPTFDYYWESESIAVLPVVSFEHWWNKQVKPATRNLVRKSEKKGVKVREATFDDDFVQGMTEIFNETPIRQGKRFWHYGKDFETVKRQFSRNLFRETLLGAYCEDELIGFVMLGNAGRYADVGQIISKIRHRDKSPNNALLAKAVEVCERERLPYLVYAYWSDGSLADFKRHNGFEETPLPRYYVPLTRRGELALSLGLHSGWKELLPAPVKTRLKRLRGRWLGRLDA